MAERKLSKASVNYRTTKAWALKRCGSCSMYVEGGRCTLVAGHIRRNDVCDRWEARR